MSEYTKHIETEMAAVPALKTIVDGLRNKTWKSILLFADDDPDGVTASTILIRALRKLGIDVHVELPAPFELEEFRVKEQTAKRAYDAIFCIDKGTCGYYDGLAKYAKSGTFVVIDHHLYQGNPEKCVVYNPKKPSCTAYLVHRIVAALGLAEDADDFVCLMGLRSDWSIRPHVTPVDDYIKPFYSQVVTKFPALFEKINDRPTWMEIDQRQWTVPLNQMAEFTFAVTGGGFQYWYGDRDKSLKSVHPPSVHLESLLAWCDSANGRLGSIKTLKDYVASLPNSAVQQRMYEWYLRDWDNGVHLMDGAFPIARWGNVTVYFFTGGDIPLLPMVGSVKLGDLVKRNADKGAAFIMAVQKNDKTTHFSMRGTTFDVHLGKMCSNLAERLVAKYGFKDEITGGGHPPAAECKARRPEIPYVSHLQDLLAYVQEVSALADRHARGELSPAEKTKAVDLGLTYAGA